MNDCDLNEAHITAFLTNSAVRRKVAGSTRNQAMYALVFLYKEVLRKESGEFENEVRAKRPKKLSVVFTREEVKSILQQLDCTLWIIGQLLYGAGLRLMEFVQLRVKDLDFGYKDVSSTMISTHVLNRGGKGVERPGDMVFRNRERRRPRQPVVAAIRCRYLRCVAMGGDGDIKTLACGSPAGGFRSSPRWHSAAPRGPGLNP